VHEGKLICRIFPGKYGCGEGLIGSQYLDADLPVLPVAENDETFIFVEIIADECPGAKQADQVFWLTSRVVWGGLP
jgi:hypothetical protein